MRMITRIFCLAPLLLGPAYSQVDRAGDMRPETVALWLFDEPEWLYPSHTLDSSAGLDAPMVLGLGGTLTTGKWGRALSTVPHPPVEIPETGEATASLTPLPIPPGRTQVPLTWHKANFAALMTGGERHLRKTGRIRQSFLDRSEPGGFRLDGGVLAEGASKPPGRGSRLRNRDRTTR